MHFSVNQLRQALNAHAFVPFYQPIISNLNNKIVGCEILARWKHPINGLLNAGCFIGSMEEHNLVDVLTRQLMNMVLGDASNMPHPEGRSFLLTLNITLSQIMSPLFRNELLALNKRLLGAGVTPVFEITEREDIRDFPDATAVFSRLNRQGMTFAVDDFGTAYADEMLLNVSRAAFIKVERTFTTRAHHPIIRRVMRLAHQSGAWVIAEGVESAEQARWLQDDGVDYLQGYHCGRPMSAERFCGHLTS